jgi:hypothetical protein
MEVSEVISSADVTKRSKGKTGGFEGTAWVKI